jgi:ATP-binding cassette subfamily B protein
MGAMRQLLVYLKEQKVMLTFALVLATINQVFSLLDPQIFRLIVDNYASRAFEIPREEFFQGIILLLLASVGVAFVSRVAKNFQDYYLSTVTQRVGATMYEKSVAHSFSLPYAAFEDERSGELLQKLQKARKDSEQLIGAAVGIIFLPLVSIIFVVGYGFYVHWLVGLMYILIIPTVGTVTFFLTRRIKAMQKEIVTETAALSGSTTETLRNVELVKSLGLENQETDRLNIVNKKILSLELRKIKVIRLLSFVQGTLINAIRSVLLLIMMYLIYEKLITFGEFFSLYIYLFFVFGPLGELGTVANIFQEARASMEKLDDILKQKPEVKPENPTTLGALDSIRFERVGFTHATGNSPAVKDLTFKIKKGEVAAFVGPSGSGKSTTIKLLVGLYKPTEGTVLVNNISGENIDYDLLRRRIGYVSQETQLFAGTIRENLLFVNPKARDEECLEALRGAAVLSIIERSTEGLDTKIGEGGIKVSGGERQRLAIARALLRNPDLIIFDEATSSLDSITEKEITKTIQDIAKTKPDLVIVMVAHRLSTIAHADTIYVLEKGSLSEAGSHVELLSKNGLYSALWRQQSAVREE